MNTTEMYLVYIDNEGNKHYQHWQDIEDVGTLIDPDTGNDMRMIGWTVEK